ncbi:hypothetical protein, partial [Klebsiella pneumoniae]
MTEQQLREEMVQIGAS